MASLAGVAAEPILRAGSRLKITGSIGPAHSLVKETGGRYATCQDSLRADGTKE